MKLRVPALSCGVVFEILSLAILIQYRLVTDRRIDIGQTDGPDTMIAYAALAYHCVGKNVAIVAEVNMSVSCRYCLSGIGIIL